LPLSRCVSTSLGHQCIYKGRQGLPLDEQHRVLGCGLRASPRTNLGGVKGTTQHPVVSHSLPHRAEVLSQRMPCCKLLHRIGRAVVGLRAMVGHTGIENMYVFLE